MFEVGKKYTNHRTKDNATCVFEDDSGWCFKWNKEGRLFLLNKPYRPDGWWVYKEPVVEKITRHFWKSLMADDKYLSHRFPPVDEDVPVAGAIEITFTDGKITDVRIL